MIEQAGLEALRTEGPITRLFAQVEKENRLGRRLSTLLQGYQEELFSHPTAAVELWSPK